ncbi:MAG: hypothetical protein O3B01_18195 [Planctomycetota bacterium]|nr:hypothetical protein [Planctomycetota bacterium]
MPASSARVAAKNNPPHLSSKRFTAPTDYGNSKTEPRKSNELAIFLDIHYCWGIALGYR